MTFPFQAQPQAAVSSKTKILLIDDDFLTRSLLRTILQKEGYREIREAAEAEAGMKMALHFEPDVICLDVNMPGKSGLELLADFKACMAKTPVVMVTSSSDRSTVEACVAAGASGLIIKPFTAGKIINTIRGLAAKA